MNTIIIPTPKDVELVEVHLHVGVVVRLTILPIVHDPHPHVRIDPTLDEGVLVPPDDRVLDCVAGAGVAHHFLRLPDHLLRGDGVEVVIVHLFLHEEKNASKVTVGVERRRRHRRVLEVRNRTRKRKLVVRVVNSRLEDKLKLREERVIGRMDRVPLVM